MKKIDFNEHLKCCGNCLARDYWYDTNGNLIERCIAQDRCERLNIPSSSLCGGWEFDNHSYSRRNKEFFDNEDKYKGINYYE